MPMEHGSLQDTTDAHTPELVSMQPQGDANLHCPSQVAWLLTDPHKPLLLLSQALLGRHCLCIYVTPTPSRGLLIQFPSLNSSAHGGLSGRLST